MTATERGFMSASSVGFMRSRRARMREAGRGRTGALRWISSEISMESRATYARCARGVRLRSPRWRASCETLVRMSENGTPAQKRPPLSRLTKVIYGSGDVGFSMTNAIVALMFGIYLTDVVGLRGRYAALAVFLGRTWDYVNDPIVGYLSDRTRTRWGRRRPWLLFGFVPFGLAFSMLWYKPAFASQTALAVYYALAYLVFDSTVTVVSTPYYALTPELTDDYDERTALTSYRMAFSIGGSLVAFTVPLAIVGAMRPENVQRVFTMGAIFGALSAAPLLLVFFHTRERPERSEQDAPGLRDSLRAAWGNKPFRFAATIFLLTWVAVDIVQASLLYFLKYRMRLERESDMVAGTIFVVALLSIPLWEHLSRRWDKRRAYLLGISFWAVIQIAMVSIAPSWPLWVTLACAALGGLGVGAAHVLPWSMLPDAVEWDEFHTGARHEGMFYALVSLAQKIASSLAVPAALLILDFTGYVPNAPAQSPSVIAGIRFMFGPIPAALLLVGLAFAARYPMSREEHESIRRELERRKSQS
jgi:GPH family glycoside/pentoside/hexuronide:cation symporter